MEPYTTTHSSTWLYHHLIAAPWASGRSAKRFASAPRVCFDRTGSFPTPWLCVLALLRLRDTASTLYTRVSTRGWRSGDFPVVGRSFTWALLAPNQRTALLNRGCPKGPRVTACTVCLPTVIAAAAVCIDVATPSWSSCVLTPSIAPVRTEQDCFRATARDACPGQRMPQQRG